MSAVKVRELLGIFRYFIRNLYVTRGLKFIESQEYAGLVIRGYTRLDAGSIAEIYSQLNNGAVFSFVQRFLYSYIGKCCLFVAEQEDENGTKKIVGMNMYYVNRQDIQDNTIHEGFIGVVPELSGRGIATKMREIAIQHFDSAGFSGISTRISLDNSASLVSARKIGFVPLEEYRDALTNDVRYYMVRKF